MSGRGTGRTMAETREITIVIDREADDELTAIAESTGRDKPTLARDALLEWLEDQEDIRDIEAVLAQGNKPMTIKEVKDYLGLES
jgi:RHH-type transcriptional regulator, rel operon repressor / antitoxin RelB